MARTKGGKIIMKSRIFFIILTIVAIAFLTIEFFLSESLNTTQDLTLWIIGWVGIVVGPIGLLINFNDL
jgi:hypothetical protein